jgi:hypothetical protein
VGIEKTNRSIKEHLVHCVLIGLHQAVECLPYRDIPLCRVQTKQARAEFHDNGSQNRMYVRFVNQPLLGSEQWGCARPPKTPNSGRHPPPPFKPPNPCSRGPFTPRSSRARFRWMNRHSVGYPEPGRVPLSSINCQPLPVPRAPGLLRRASISDCETHSTSQFRLRNPSAISQPYRNPVGPLITFVGYLRHIASLLPRNQPAPCDRDRNHVECTAVPDDGATYKRIPAPLP